MRLQRQFSPFSPTGEKNSGKSMTQPDMTLSLAELLRRHSRGQEIPTFEGDYTGDEFIPDPRSLDLADVSDLMDRNAEQIENLSLKAKSGAKPAGRKSAVASESDQGNGRIGEAEGEVGEAPSPSRTEPVDGNG